MRNVILTGIPRSGTTLAAALIDGLADCVCLNEPPWQISRAPQTEPQQLADWLVDDFARIRRHMLAEHPVPDRRTEEGRPVTNFYEAGQPPQGQQSRLFIRAGLTEQFTLAMKHNALYLASLPHLVQLKSFTIIALIRHPVHTIASWQRLNLPVSSGRMPHAARYWPELGAISESHEDTLVKQVKLYDLICQRLHNLRDSIHILPYETLIATPQLLCDAIGHDGPADSSLITPTTAPDAPAIAGTLRTHGTHWQQFYPQLT